MNLNEINKIFFSTTKRGEISELKEELLSTDKKRKVMAMKQVVANMTVGNDMGSLYPEVLACMQTPFLELKKMVYLFLMNYSKAKQDLALLTVNSFVKDTEDFNPLIRGLALRTMSYIQVDKINEAMPTPLRRCLKDQDPYVRKTAVLCVAKLFRAQKSIVEDEGFVDLLKEMVFDSNSVVVANSLAALNEINQFSEEEITLNLNFDGVMKLLTALNEATEWGLVYIMEALLMYIPAGSLEADTIIERVAPRLAHVNSSVILSTIKVILHCMKYGATEDAKQSAYRKMGPPLVTLLRSQPEIQYVALKNILLLIQKRPDILDKEPKVFFCEYSDPIYVKLAKLEVLIRIANESNVELLLAELKEYASEVDVDFVRRSVRTIGICAVKIEKATDRCVEVLLELIQTKVNYVVQEAIIVIRDIFRKYPNRYESIIGTLCENLDTLDEPEAKASMIWIIGHYADRIDNSHELLDTFLDTFLEESTEVQSALLTACMKLFLRRSQEGEPLIKKILKWVTEDIPNPDLRDRGFIYWRLLSTDPMSAKAIVFSEKPPSTEGTVETMEKNILDELISHIGSLASVYHKPPSAFLNIKKKASSSQVDIAVQKSETEKIQEEIQKSIVSNGYSTNDYSAPGTQASVGGGVMNLLDLDLDEYSSGAIGDINVDYLGGDSGVISQIDSPQVPSRPSNTNPLADLDLLSNSNTAANQSTSSVLFSQLSLEQKYVAPKQVLLSAQAAKGLEVHGTFARRGGSIFLEATFYNRALQSISDTAIFFNSNSFGIQPLNPPEIPVIHPNSSIEVVIPLGFNPASLAPKDPVNNLQVAIKNNVSTFYFQTLLPVHILFPENGAVERSEYLKTWKEIPDQNEFSTQVGSLNFTSTDAIKNKLNLNNIFTVAERQVEDRTLLYCSTCVLPQKKTFLIEFNFEASLHACSVSIKTYATELIKPFQEAVIAVLQY